MVHEGRAFYDCVIQKELYHHKVDNLKHLKTFSKKLHLIKEIEMNFDIAPAITDK